MTLHTQRLTIRFMEADDWRALMDALAEKVCPRFTAGTALN